MKVAIQQGAVEVSGSGQLNLLYSYVDNNPLVYIDPFGLHGQFSRHRGRQTNRLSPRDQAARLSTASDIFTLATPFSGPFAPAMGTLATVTTMCSVAMSSANDDASGRNNGIGSLATNALADAALSKVKGPLELSNAAFEAAKAAADVPRALSGIAGSVAGSAE